MNFYKLLLLLFIAYSCNSDDNADSDSEQTILAFTGCCMENPYNERNVDEIGANVIPDEFFTPNNDGYNDTLTFINIQNFPSNNVKIYNDNNVLVADIDNYNNETNSYNSDAYEILEGVYRYRVVIDDEDSYILQGYVCCVLFGELGLDTFSCDPLDIDPVIP